MPVRIVEGQKPYTAGPGIDIDANKVISLLLREENNLIYINDNDEAYVDLQLQSGLTPNSDFPVGVTVGKVLQSDGWTKSGLVLNRKTTSGDYARWIYATDGELYFDKGTGVRNQVYYSSEVDALLATLDAKIDALADSLAEVAYTGEYLDTINRPDVCVIEITALSNGIGTGTILSGSLIDGSVVDLSMAQGVTGTINEVDVDNKQISLSITRSAVDGMIGIYKEDNSSNYTIYLFDGDAGQAQVNADWDATSGVAEILNRPAVVNDTTSTSITDVLSANMGKELQDQINNLKSRGRFLSNWNATTGLPTTNPTTLPYQYNSGDYFVVTTVGATNYRPSGTSYTGTASSTVETETLAVGDMYIFDSSTWLLQINTARTIVVDQALDATSTNPVENRVITNALGQKQDTLVSGTNIKTVKGTSLLGSGDVAISEFSPSNSGSTGQVLKKTSTGYNWANETSQVSDTAYGSSWDGVTGTAPSKNAVYDKLNAMDTTIAGKQATLSAGTGISISSNTVTNTGVTSVNGNTGDVTVAEFKATNGGVKIFDMPSVNGDMAAIVEWLTGGGDVILRTISSNVETYYTVIEWDGTNRTIKAENSDGDTVVVYTITYNASGTCTAVTNQSYSGGGDAKVFEISDLTSAASLATATQAYTYAYTNGKCAIIRYQHSNFVYAYGTTAAAYFSRAYGSGAISSGVWARLYTLTLTVSSGSVTAIAENINQIVISTTEPASGTSNGTITLVI